MAWTGLQMTLRCSNQSDYTPYVDVTLDLLAAPPERLQDEAGEREPGANGRKFQNIVQSEAWDLVVRAFAINGGEWSMGHWDDACAYFRAKHVRIQAVTESGMQHMTHDEDGDDISYWTAKLLTEVKVIIGKQEYTIGRQRWMRQPIRLEKVTLDVGVTIT